MIVIGALVFRGAIVLESQDPYGKRALDFVVKLQTLDDFEAIFEHTIAEFEWFGYTAVSGWRMPGPGENPTACLLFNTRPQSYVDHYIKEHYISRDPVIKELRLNLRPFTWSELRFGRRLTRSEREILDEAREFDGYEGLVVPIATREALSIVSSCGRSPDISERAKAAVEIIGIYAYEAMRRAIARALRSAEARPSLTPREREILHWVAAGKTDDEIADILSISTTTVTAHVENAKRKLNAARRTFAVVQAIRSGELTI